MAEQQPIQPSVAPLGVSPGFISDQPTILVLKERLSFSGDDYTIHTAQGADVIRVDGKYMSMSGRKEFISPAGQHLFTLRKELFAIPRSWYIEGPGGEKFCFLNGRFSFGKAKLDVTFKNTANQSEDVKLEVRGNFFDRNADITWQGRPVCKIRRQFMNWAEVFGRQTYGVEVAPGVDVALMCAIVVGIDEQRNEK